MKKLNFMLGMGMLCAMPMFALTSPYTGTTPNTEGAAKFYLYQVDTGRWLQFNKDRNDAWTTRAELGSVGLDFSVEKIDGGYQINPRLNGNHSLNAVGLYMDTGQGVTTWTFQPVTVDGVTNAYKIVATTGNDSDKAKYPRYLGVGGDNFLSSTENDGNHVWQLVTPEERKQYVIDHAGTDEGNATWMIPWQDFDRNNQRGGENWILKTNGGINETAGINYNSWRHTRNNSHGYVHYTTLTGLPNGTYRVRVQGFFREEWNGDIYWYRYAAGHTPRHCYYFAGASEHLFMHAADPGFKTKPCENHPWMQSAIAGNVFYADDFNTVGHAFRSGLYTNPDITAIVTDGTLTLGVKKLHGSDWDDLYYDNFQLFYESTSTEGADQQYTDFKARVSATLEKDMVEYPNNAVGTAKEKFGKATDINSLRLADLEYVNSVYGTFVKRDIDNFHKTYALAQEEGVEDLEHYMNRFYSLQNNDELNTLLRDLRYARRRNAAERHEDVFAGNVPAAGEFYLYNVGQKQFLCGGSDWGAHAALGMPGVPITLVEGDAANLCFFFDTNLYNGDNNHFLNYRGYMDAGKPEGMWKFVPVEGKEGVYNIVQNDYPDVHIAYNPFASVNDGQSDETTVGTECRDLQPDDLDAQWKLVTKEERLALMAAASSKNPVDVTFLIKSPNFNNRESKDAWTMTDCGVWDGGGNHYDYLIESWDKGSSELSQTIEAENLPEGVYSIHVQGYYRNGKHLRQPFNEPKRFAVLYAGEQTTDAVNGAPDFRAPGDPSYAETPLVNILEGANKLPGEGTDAYNESEEFHSPDACMQAVSAFKLGLYNNMVAIHKYSADTPLKIGVKKTERAETPDWTVTDNFRLKYYGKGTSTGIEGVEAETVVEAEAEANAPVYNLQGIRVNDTTVPGIYIRNGRKFVVK